MVWKDIRTCEANLVNAAIMGEGVQKVKRLWGGGRRQEVGFPSWQEQEN